MPKATATKPWHPVDDCIKPLAEAFQAAADAWPPKERPDLDLEAALQRLPVTTCQRWLEVNVSPEYARLFGDRVKQPLERLRNWAQAFSEVPSQSVDDLTGPRIEDDGGINDELRGNLDDIGEELAATSTYLIELGIMLRARLGKAKAVEGRAADVGRKAAELGAVDEERMQVYASRGWVDVDGRVLKVVTRLTESKGAWLKNWQCFGTKPHTNNRLDKLKMPAAIRHHIESDRKGYRWVDVPKRARRRKPA